MISPEERESIVSEAVERAITLTPDLARKLLVQRMSEDKLKLAFLEKLIGDDPKYKQWTKIIEAVVEKKEKDNPGNLSQALEEAIPEIKSMISKVETMDFKGAEKPIDTFFKERQDLGDPGSL